MNKIGSQVASVTADMPVAGSVIPVDNADVSVVRAEIPTASTDIPMTCL